MKNKKLTLIVSRSFLILICGSLFFACQDKEKREAEQKDEIVESSKEKESTTKENTIVTNSMEFKTKDEWESGWNTIKYKNNSNETHFVIMEKYPEGKGIEDANAELVPPFQEGMNAIIAGNPEETNAAFAKIPEWFQQVQFKGGIGLTSAKTTSESTVYLEPGTYLMECYVKMANGVFHSAQGMLKEIKVIQADSTGLKLNQDHIIKIDATNGITFEDRVSPGEKIFKVEFGEQKVHENFNKHDVHLVWVDAGADIMQLNNWMNWASPEGLQTPSPQGFRFIGGMQELNEGGVGYFKADLKPGTYALVSEVPDPQSKGMLKTFTVK